MTDTTSVMLRTTPWPLVATSFLDQRVYRDDQEGRACGRSTICKPEEAALNAFTLEALKVTVYRVLVERLVKTASV